MGDTVNPEIRCIFCISTGRSGTDYLCKLFSHAEKSESHHEPRPIGYATAMRRWQRGDSSMVRDVAAAKKEKIQAANEKGCVYVETNHCFVKGFGWHLSEFVPEAEIGVVVLTRERAKVAKSFLRTGYTPLTRSGRRWVLDPSLGKPGVHPPTRLGLTPFLTFWLFRFVRFFFRGKKVYNFLRLPKPATPSFIVNYDLELCEWYVDETADLGKRFQERFPAIRFHAVTLDDLNDVAKVTEMFQTFGLQPSASLADVVGKPTNLKVTGSQAPKPTSGKQKYHAD